MLLKQEHFLDMPGNLFNPNDPPPGNFDIVGYPLTKLQASVDQAGEEGGTIILPDVNAVALFIAHKGEMYEAKAFFTRNPRAQVCDWEEASGPMSDVDFEVAVRNALVQVPDLIYRRFYKP